MSDMDTPFHFSDDIPRALSLGVEGENARPSIYKNAAAIAATKAPILAPFFMAPFA
jgi:hypothetical protein